MLCRGSENDAFQSYNVFCLSNIRADHSRLDYMQYDHARISRLSKRLIDGIQSQVEQVIRNGDDQNTYPGTALCFFADKHLSSLVY